MISSCLTVWPAALCAFFSKDAELLRLRCVVFSLTYAVLAVCPAVPCALFSKAADLLQMHGVVFALNCEVLPFSSCCY